MEKTRLGKTNLMVSRTSFGTIPIQRISYDNSTSILRKAYSNGVNFFDTARGYGTSENRLSTALGDVRENIVIATKSLSAAKEALEADIETSLIELNTDYIDIFQFHNPSYVPRPGDSVGLYDAAHKAKAEGKIKHIGITSHNLELAREMVMSGLYETMQFPISILASDEELKLVELCKDFDVGFIGMKVMAGGLISDAKAAFVFVRQFDNVVPVWGIQYMWELDEILQYENNPPVLDTSIWDTIYKDREELSVDFCRACGYCLPCPALINIPMAARAQQFVSRMIPADLVDEDFKAMMRKVNDCTNCHECIRRCAYDLDIPALLRKHLEFYEGFLRKCEKF